MTYLNVDNVNIHEVIKHKDLNRHNFWMNGLATLQKKEHISHRESPAKGQVLSSLLTNAFKNNLDYLSNKSTQKYSKRIEELLPLLLTAGLPCCSSYFLIFLNLI